MTMSDLLGWRWKEECFGEPSGLACNQHTLPALVTPAALLVKDGDIVGL